jgi:hypothetical protein
VDAEFLVSIYYNQVEADPIGVTIHRGEFGSNGEQVYEVISGYFESDTTVTMAFNPGDCEDPAAERFYVVIRTETYPEGELRGQIGCEWLGPAVRTDTWGRIKSLYDDRETRDSSE